MYLGMLLITPVNASCSPPRPGGEGTAGGGEVGVGGGGRGRSCQVPAAGARLADVRKKQRHKNEPTNKWWGMFFSERDLWTPLDHGRGEYHRSPKAGKGT